MSTIAKDLPPTKREYDYIIIGGGTAGCLLASRLSEQLPEATILMIEGGESELGRDDLHNLKNQFDNWCTDVDYDYKSVPQLNGNSFIHHSRGKALGGCTTINGCISFIPNEYDARQWQKAGATGWTFDEFVRLFRSLPVEIHPVLQEDQNPADLKLGAL